MNTIPERIKLAMEVRNKKQIELVKETGISKGALSCYLSGLYKPKQDKLQLIANALDVDVRWLQGHNVPIQTTSPKLQYDTGFGIFPEYIFYDNTSTEFLLENTNDMYIGLMNQYAALIPRFYVLVNASANTMHLLPIFLRGERSKYYKCPSEFFDPKKHKIFTRDFESIKMYVITSRIYYYGIDTQNYTPMITQLTYSQEIGCYEYASASYNDAIKEFVREVEKEAFFLSREHSS